MIEEIAFEEMLHIWRTYLWPHRTSAIESHSAMNFLGGYDIKNMNSEPSFFAYIQDSKILGVNSGHKCFDNSYRSRGLFVFPEYRNKGIGVSLLKETILQGIKESSSFVWSYPRKTSWSTYKNAGFNLSSDWKISETSDSNAYCKIDL